MTTGFPTADQWTYVPPQYRGGYSLQAYQGLSTRTKMALADDYYRQQSLNARNSALLNQSVQVGQSLTQIGFQYAQASALNAAASRSSRRGKQAAVAVLQEAERQVADIRDTGRERRSVQAAVGAASGVEGPGATSFVQSEDLARDLVQVSRLQEGARVEAARLAKRGRRAEKGLKKARNIQIAAATIGVVATILTGGLAGAAIYSAAQAVARPASQRATQQSSNQEPFQQNRNQLGSIGGPQGLRQRDRRPYDTIYGSLV